MPDAHRESDAECDMSGDLRRENLCDVGRREGGEGELWCCNARCSQRIGC